MKIFNVSYSKYELLLLALYIFNTVTCFIGEIYLVEAVLWILLAVSQWLIIGSRQVLNKTLDSYRSLLDEYRKSLEEQQDLVSMLKDSNEALKKLKTILEIKNIIKKH